MVWGSAFFDMDIFSGLFHLFNPLRSDMSENMNALQSCLIVEIEVVVLIKSDTYAVFSYLAM